MINTENPDRSKARLNNQVLNTKEKFLKEVKYCCTREHTNDKRVKSLTADREKVLVVWTDEASHSIPLSQSLIQSKAPTLSSSVKLRGQAAEARRGWFVRFNERRHPHNVKEQGEATSAHILIDAVASYLAEPAKVINEGGDIN